MDSAKSSISLAEAGKIIQNTSGRIVLFTHVKPDGDAYGSVTALHVALEELGHLVTSYLVPPIPSGIMRLDGMGVVEIDKDNTTDVEGAELYIVVDTSAYSQLGPAADIIKNNLERTIVIDHHFNGNIKSKYRYIDTDAPACCELIAKFIDENLLISKGGMQKLKSSDAKIMRDSLFVGIATDTGWFRFSNTLASTHYWAGKLLEQGVNHAQIYRTIEQMERPEKLSLLTCALESIKYLADNRAAFMTLARDDFKQTGALDQETERLIDVPQQLETLQVVALLSERLNEDKSKTNKYYTRVSFRSKPGPDAIDVAKLAGKLGGGGHVRAAGARVDEPIEKVAKQVTKLLKDAFN